MAQESTHTHSAILAMEQDGHAPQPESSSATRRTSPRLAKATQKKTDARVSSTSTADSFTSTPLSPKPDDTDNQGSKRRRKGEGDSNTVQLSSTSPDNTEVPQPVAAEMESELFGGQAYVRSPIESFGAAVAIMVTGGSVDDDPGFEEISGAWEDLRRKVVEASGVACRLNPSVSWSNIDSINQAKIKSWCSKGQEYFENPRTREYIVRACIWHTIDEYAFAPESWSARFPQGPYAALGSILDSFREFDEPWQDKPFTKPFSLCKGLAAMMARRQDFSAFFDVNAVSDRLLEAIRGVLGAYEETDASLMIVYLVAEYLGHVETWIHHSVNRYWLTWRPGPALSEGDRTVSEGFPLRKAEHRYNKDKDAVLTVHDVEYHAQAQLAQLVVQPALVAVAHAHDPEWTHEGPYVFLSPIVVMVDDD